MNKKITFNVVFISALYILFISPILFARYARPLTYESTRTLAMGGASVAVADDQQAMFSNPAGLANRTSNAYSIVNMQGIRNEDFSAVNNSITSLDGSDTQASRLNNNNQLSSVMGKTGYQSFSNLAYYIGKGGFSTALYYKDSEMYKVANPTSPTLTSKVDKDVVFSGSLARPFKEKQNLFKDIASGWWGSTIKFISRKSADKTFYSRDFAALSEHNVKDTNESGAAFDFDLGALWQLTDPLQASIGIFAGNVLESEFSAETGSLHRQIAVGASFKPLTGPPSRNDKLLLAADYWDIDGKGSLMTKIRLGMEAKLSNIIKLQLGLRGGYPTGGVSFNWGDAHLEAATYGEELGEHPGDDEDRRYALSFGFQF